MLDKTLFMEAFLLIKTASLSSANILRGVIPWLAAVPVLWMASEAIAADNAAEKGRPPDCGVNALFLLLNLEGRPITIDRLERALPARNPQGYSMAELSAASQAMGLPLDGVKFDKGDEPLDRPAIAFFKDAKAGHFALLRPVGATGTMVQLIDPPHAPQILDYSRLFQSKTWTGRVLIRREPWFVRYARPLIVAAVALSATLFLAAFRWRRRGSAAGRGRAETEGVEAAGMAGPSRPA